MNKHSAQERKLHLHSNNNSIEYTEATKWLYSYATERNIELRYFISFSYRRPSKDYYRQSLENRHIKAIILRFLYGKNIPSKDKRVKLFFFIEKNDDGNGYHCHLIMSSLCTRSIQRMCNRYEYNGDKIFIPSIIRNTTKKKITDEYFEGFIINRMLRGIKDHTHSLGTGGRSTDARYIGDSRLRIGYCNKSVEYKVRYSLSKDGIFDCIDVMNSDYDG